MGKILLNRNYILIITAMLSVCCILASVLIVVLIGVFFNQQDNTFALAMGFVCPTIIAPIAIYSSLRLSTKLEESRQRVEKLDRDLKQASSEIETLSGMLPICSSCKKIRDSQGYWNQIESYISKHSDTKFSHGICDECANKLYGKEDWYKKSDNYASKRIH